MKKPHKAFKYKQSYCEFIRYFLVLNIIKPPKLQDFAQKLKNKPRVKKFKRGHFLSLILENVVCARVTFVSGSLMF